jgi:hypothetical protein
MTSGTSNGTQTQYSEPDHMPDHTPEPSGSDHTQAPGSGDDHQICVSEGQWVLRRPSPRASIRSR